MAAPRQRVATGIRTGTQTTTQGEVTEETIEPPRYPYLPAGFETGSREEYLGWLQEAEGGGDSTTPPVCEERFSRLLGTWAGFTLAHPTEWSPVYEDLKAGDIAILRLADCYAPDWVRDGRTVGSFVDPSEDWGARRPEPTLPRGPELDLLLDSAASILRPPMRLPDVEDGEDGRDGRYNLPPHEIFTEAATVFGLGPIGLGLVTADAEHDPALGHHHAPIGMFLPFPVELLDYLLDPSQHDGDWFEGFSTKETEGTTCPIRAPISERSGRQGLCYLTESEFRRFVQWIQAEFDPDGWFETNLAQLEEASREIRRGGGRLSDGRDGGPGSEIESGWSTWDLSSPTEGKQVRSLWGMGQLDLVDRERWIYGMSRLCEVMDLGQHGTRLRYALERFHDATRDAARLAALARFSIKRFGTLRQGILSEKDDLLVSLSKHQIESMILVIDAIDRGPVLPYHRYPNGPYVSAPGEASGLNEAILDLFPEMKGRLETSDLWNERVDFEWNGVSDDLAHVYLSWLRGARASSLDEHIGAFTIPVTGTADVEVRESFEGVMKERFPGPDKKGDQTYARVANQVFVFNGDDQTTRLLHGTIYSNFWNHRGHPGSKTQLMPITAREALACWEASFSLTPDSRRFVASEPLHHPDSELRPEWLADIRPLAKDLSDDEILNEMTPRSKEIRERLVSIVAKASDLFE